MQKHLKSLKNNLINNLKGGNNGPVNARTFVYYR